MAVDHAITCPRHLGWTGPPGHCSCGRPVESDRRTIPLFADLACPLCGGVDHAQTACPTLEPGAQLVLLP